MYNSKFLNYIYLTITVLFFFGIKNTYCQSIFSSGHGELTLNLNDSQDGLDFTFQAPPGSIVDGQSISENQTFKTDQIVFQASDSSKNSRPENNSTFNFDPLGVAEGEDIYELDITGVKTPIFGFVMSPLLGQVKDFVPVNFDLISAVNTSSTNSTNDHYSVYQIDFFNPPTPEFFISTFDNGVTSQDTFPVFPSTQHGHANMAFSTPGIWKLTFQGRATLNDNSVITGQDTLTVQVIPEPTTFALMILALITLIILRFNARVSK